MSSEIIITSKFKGILLPSLLKVQKQVQPSLTVDHEALVYLEGLIMRLLCQLCSGQPHSIPDLDEKMARSFPNQMMKWAIDDAQANIVMGNKKKLTLSVDKLTPIITKEVLQYKIDPTMAMYLVAVLEYISADILKLAGNYVKNIRHSEITEQDIKVAMGADNVLLAMFHYENIDLMQPVLESTSKRGSLMYIEVLKEFRIAEEQYLQQLNLIIKVFQEPMVKAKDLFSSDDIENIFSNIQEIYDLTAKLYGMIETAFEMANNSGTDPLIGYYIEDLAVGCEFDYYDTYAVDQVIDDDSDTEESSTVDISTADKIGKYRKIRDILEKPGVRKFFEEKKLFHSVKYILPKLLYGPIYHCQDYFEYFRQIKMTSPDDEDRELLGQSLDLLGRLETMIEEVLVYPALKRSPEAKMFFDRCMGTAVPNATAKIMSIQANIEGWEGKDLCQIASLFLKEGTLTKLSADGKRQRREREVYLFDNLLLCAKPNTRIAGFSQAEYKLKERINLRKAEVLDMPDTDNVRHAFEVSELDKDMKIAVTLICESDNEKYEWLSYLMTLHHRSTLDRMFDAILQEEEQNIDLCYPDPKVYIFAEEDSHENIVFENSGDDGHDVPVIKGGKLHKLVERLTYHKYADPSFVSVFLTTYRSFSNPVELLDLLIKRYNIPDPVCKELPGSSAKDAVMRRFKKEYIQPIQLRVLNVLRHWVDQHFYDFQREHAEVLLTTLQKFLQGINRNKSAKKWIANIEKIVNKRLEAASTPEHFTFNTATPQIEWHIATTLDKFSLLTLHPLEIGRQLTLMQSEIFRAIKPSELVGTGEGKEEGKEKSAPNKTKLINLTNSLTNWYKFNICEALNLEERVAVYSRIIDIMQVFLDLNNFNGIMEIVGALNSAAVHRLQHTSGMLSQSRKQVIEECLELFADHEVKYTEKLRSINPPCVPFLGSYLTNIFKTNDGNPDDLKNSKGLINFSKRRMVAAITSEIRKYQDTPYNLDIQPFMREYFESLDLHQGRTNEQVDDYLYNRSLMIEPRDADKPAKFPRATDIPLKSPGTKPASRNIGTSGSSSRKTSIQTFESGRPSSPTPSTVSGYFTVTIPEDTDNVDGEEEERGVETPPPLLPRAPTIDESPPGIPHRPFMFKQSDGSDAVFSDFQATDDTPPPELPPRTPITPHCGSPSNVFILRTPEPPPPLPIRSVGGEIGEVSSSDMSLPPPPVPPPRNSKPQTVRQRHSDSTGMGLSVSPPQLPPRRNTQPK